MNRGPTGMEYQASLEECCWSGRNRRVDWVDDASLQELVPQPVVIHRPLRCQSPIVDAGSKVSVQVVDDMGIACGCRTHEPFAALYVSTHPPSIDDDGITKRLHTETAIVPEDDDVVDPRHIIVAFDGRRQCLRRDIWHEWCSFLSGALRSLEP